MTAANISMLVEIMKKLRSPEGCPWDREQTHDSLKPYLIEEAYEVLEAIELKDASSLEEELGDLLLQVVFHAQLAEEKRQFDMNDVIRGISEKLIRRHPHVFAGMDLKTSEEVLVHWKKIKADEKGKSLLQEKHSILDGLPKDLPPLTEAVQLTRRAAEVGFDWPTLDGIFEKLGEEVGEIQEAIRSGKEEEIREELGDLFFVLANLARRLLVDPELAMRSANRKFQRRFRGLERELQEKDQTLAETSLEEMDTLWEKRKRSEK
jgi:tetrapyrrole methylase family protein / MazG family protein